jgi:hypothetical protein
MEKEPLDPARAAVVFANHHYWWDGYVCYLLAHHWRRERGMVWMREWRVFPPFHTVGAMPFPDDDMRVRIRTVRRTLRRLRDSPSVLFLFPERDLHPAPVLLPFQRVLFWLHRQLPDVTFVPAAVQIVAGIHEYPELYILRGLAFRSEEENEEKWLNEAQSEVARLLEALDAARQSEPERFQCILEGKRSINERWRCSGRPPGGS